MVVVSKQKGKIINHNFIFKDQSFPILKHYLSVKFGWSKCLQEIVLVHHFAVPFFPM